MNYAKKTARKFIFPTLMKLGVDKLLRTIKGNSITNVLYHGVVNKDSSYFSPRHIQKDQFEKHLKYYKKHFKIISIDEAFKISNPDKRYLTVSFDDGYKNNLTNALPLLEKYNIPTTFFICSACVEGTNQLSTDSLAAYYSGQKLELLPEEIWKLLNIDELIKLSESRIVTIGSHGRFHNYFTERNAIDELRISKELLFDTINKRVNLIAYPFGSYNGNIKNLAEIIGYTGQLAVKYKLHGDKKDKRIMKRHCISSTTTFESNMIQLCMT